jgi:MFS family permease
MRPLIVRDSGRAAVVLAVGTTVAGGIPVFLVGALFVQLREDVAAPTWVLGLAVAAYWAGAAVVSMLSGRIIGAIGTRASMVTTLVAAAASLLGSALLVPTWPWLVGWAVLGGFANGLGHPASNTSLSQRVRPDRRATALGIKQAAVPFASTLAGLTVPVVALTLGWRWAFALVAVIAALLVLAFLRWGPRRGAVGAIRRAHVPLGRPLLTTLLAIASVTTIGAAAAGAASSYAVTVGIERGIDDATAGVLLSGGSLLGAACRVVAGIVADRTGGRPALPMVVVMLAAGAVGSALMGLDSTVAYVAGVVLALGIGWGWTGLTHYVVSSVAGPATPSATGVVQTGSYIGSGGGPLLFGLGFAATGAHWLWFVVAAVELGAALIALRLHRSGITRPASIPHDVNARCPSPCIPAREA